MSESKSGKCSQCGKEIIDPYCEEACPRHLCSECGMKCFESLPHNEDDWPDPDKCGECPYDVDPEYDEPDEPTPEEMQDLIDEEAELEYGEEEYY